MLTFDQVKELLGEKDLPGSPKTVQRLVDNTGVLINRYGEKWLRDSRGRLLEEWKIYVDATDFDVPEPGIKKEDTGNNFSGVQKQDEPQATMMNPNDPLCHVSIAAKDKDGKVLETRGTQVPLSVLMKSSTPTTDRGETGQSLIKLLPDEDTGTKE